MRDVRLLLVLVLAMGLIVVGGVAVPILLSLTVPTAVHTVSPEVQAAEEAPEPLPPMPADLDRLSARFRAVAKRVKPAVVAIGVRKTVEATSGPLNADEFFRRFFGRGAERPGRRTRRFEQQGLGSGVIVDPSGYILTNNHVVADADQITVRLADGRDFDAEVIGRDPPSEIAVIRIKADRLPVVTLGDTAKMEVGDWVLAVGAPFGLEQTVTAGIISATGRHRVGITEYENFIQTDAAINPGNSGGPLVNMQGEVIGINTAIATERGSMGAPVGYMGVGFAIPMDTATEVMKRLREKGTVVRGWLGVGIQPLTAEMAESMKIKADEGVLVSQVFGGGPADKAGIKAGDVVVEFNGKPVKDPNELQSAVAWTDPGTSAEVVVLRDGKRKTLQIKVETRADQPEILAQAKPEAPAAIEDLGIEVSGVTDEAAERFGYEPGQGVLVMDVDPQGLAYRAGIREGMLILQVAGKKVGSVTDLKATLKTTDLARGVPLLVRAGDRQMFILMKQR
ncbi:MAG TPA: DegQ family serine endoprotease [Phycisphaerae bacterium]|nr:DegQ family serine endoprotease [Phycisphaerae bacterium]